MDWLKIQAGVFAVGLGGLWVYSLYSGKTFKHYIELARMLMELLHDVISAIDEKCPSEVTDILLSILEIAKTAAAYAEQLFKNGTITKEARKQAAIEYAYAALEMLGVELTDTIKTIVEGAVEAACLLDIPHGTKQNIEA